MNKVISTWFSSIVTVVFLCSTLFLTQAQNINGQIKGKIIDSKSLQALPGAAILIRETQKGVSTNELGEFTFTDVKEGTYSLEVRYIGYEIKLINDINVIRNKTVFIEISLQESSLHIKEVNVKVAGSKFENNKVTPVSIYSFSREEISLNPGSQADIFRAIGMLPGVSSSGGEYSAIAVRGQGVRENAYIVDDIPLTEVGHLEGNSSFNDPNGGRYSIFAPRVIDNAQFQGGGFSAEFGRKSASYLGLGIKEGNNINPIFDGQFDFQGITFNYDGPSYLLKKTSIFTSVRYQDFRLILRMVGVRYAGYPIYGDFVFKSVTNINANNKLSFIAIISPENFVRDTANVSADKSLNDLRLAEMNGNKIITGLNLRTIINQKSSIKNILYYTNTSTHLSGGRAFPITDSNGNLINTVIPFDNKIQNLDYTEAKFGYRSIYTVHFENKSRLTAGIDLSEVFLQSDRTLNKQDTLFVFDKNDFRPNPNLYYSLISPVFFNSSYNDAGFEASAYINYSFTIFKILSFNTGIRYDYSGFADQHMISPRLSGSLYFNEKTSLNFATGIYYQDPLYIDVADQPKNNLLKSEKVAHYILGLRTYFTPDLKFIAEAWYKTFDNLVTRPISGSVLQNNDGTGWGAGIDLNITKRLTKKIHGQIGYSYMQSMRDDHDGLGEYNFAFSQPHQLNFLLSYKLNDKLVFSAKFRYATGKPTDEYIIHSNIFNNTSYYRYSQEITNKNTERLPDFICFDIRANYKMSLKRVNLNIFMDIVDVLNRQIVNGIAFNSILGTTYYDGLSIFPSFGVKFEF